MRERVTASRLLEFMRALGSEVKTGARVYLVGYDLYMQALAKIERGHQTDLEDVRQMIQRRLIDSKQLLEVFTSTENELYKYPAVDPKSFRRSVEKLIEESLGYSN